jgi:hypothetical protein
LEIQHRYEKEIEMTKKVHNDACGVSGCNLAASKRVLFSVGFSASFCDKCADELVTSNIGTYQNSSANHTEDQI